MTVALLKQKFTAQLSIFCRSIKYLVMYKTGPKKGTIKTTASHIKMTRSFSFLNTSRTEIIVSAKYTASITSISFGPIIPPIINNKMLV